MMTKFGLSPTPLKLFSALTTKVFHASTAALKIREPNNA